jgi:amino acid transporter
MKQSLRLFDVTCLGINAIVGSGIFLLPDDLYRHMGPLSPFAFLLCALGLLPVALCYAEAASRTDSTGGPYVYAREAFGPWLGFGVGWMCIANAVFSFAAVAAASAAYVGKLIPAVAGAVEPIVAALVIAAFAALNYRGVKPGAVAINLFTLGKIAALLMLLLVLVPQISASRFEGGLPDGPSGIGAAVFLALFAAQGFEVVPVPASETQQAKRIMPKAILASLIVASLLYCLVQAVMVGASDTLAQVSDTPLVDAALGVAPVLGVAVLVGGLISTFGYVAGSALGTPRYVYAAAVDRFLPKQLASIHQVFHSPHRAVVVTASIAMGLTLAFDYRSLVGMSNVSVAVQYLVTCWAVLRFRRAGEATGFRAPGGWATPLIGMAVSLWVFTEASGQELLFAAGAMGVGVVVSRVSR